MDWSAERFGELDREGRCVATDHGAFVLLNLYCPALTSDDPTKLEERKAFKRDFHDLVRFRCDQLLQAGREVIVAGDLNVSAEPIDSCDPGPIMEFWERPHRQWMLRLSGKTDGVLVDTFRRLHSTRTNAYTCWNTAADARKFNHGTRLDYVLASKGLAEQLIYADICPEVEGSDHCPSYAKFQLSAKSLQAEGEAEVQSSKREDSKDWEPEIHTPLCTCFYPEFTRGRQQKLGSFFQASTKPIAPEITLNNKSITKKLTEPIKKRKRPLVKQQSSLASFFKSADEVRLKESVKKQMTLSTNIKSQSSVSKPTSNQQPHDNAFQQQSQNIESCQPLRENPKAMSSSARSWKDLMKPKNVVMCWHKEPAVERVVKKPGPNKDRRFYVCTKPAGDYPKNKDARCDFFQWKTTPNTVSNKKHIPSFK